MVRSIRIPEADMRGNVEVEVEDADGNVEVEVEYTDVTVEVNIGGGGDRGRHGWHCKGGGGGGGGGGGRVTHGWH